MNVEFESIKDFEEFLKYFVKQNINGKYGILSNVTEVEIPIVKKDIPVVKNKKQMEVLEKKVESDLKELNVVKNVKNDCSFPGCKYPQKRHYHKSNTSEKIAKAQEIVNRVMQEKIANGEAIPN